MHTEKLTIAYNAGSRGTQCPFLDSLGTYLYTVIYIHIFKKNNF